MIAQIQVLDEMQNVESVTGIVGLEEASDPETWMEVHHFNVRGEDHQFVHSWG